MTLADMSENEHDGRVLDNQPNFVSLQPFAHQVGGHSCFMLYNKSTVCKPLRSKEYEFYLQMPEALKSFTPEFKDLSFGVLLKADVAPNMELQKLLLREIALVIYTAMFYQIFAIHQRRFFKGKKRKSVDIILMISNIIVATGVAQTTLSQLLIQSILNLCNWQRWVEGRKDHKENHSSGACSHPRFPSDVSNPWTKEVLWRLWERTPCERRVLETFILLENVTMKYKRPCILDLKMGVRQYSEDASPEKIDRRLKRVQVSTSGTLGTRLCGMKVYNPVEKSYIFVDKYKGRVMSREELEGSIKQFFDQNSMLRVELLQNCISKLISLTTCLKSLQEYRFYSSSLLLMYDACAKDSIVDVRVIDFANVSSNESCADIRTYDEGFIFGLQNLVYILEDICDEFKDENRD